MRELFGSDEAVKFALAANIGYYHDDPERMLFLRYAIPQASISAAGGHYVRGGSQALTDRLVALIKEPAGNDGGRSRSGPFGSRMAKSLASATRARRRREREEPAAMIFGNAAPQVLAAMLPRIGKAAFLAPYADRRIVEFVVDDIARGKSAAARVRCSQLLHLRCSRLDAQPFANARSVCFDGRTRPVRARALLRGWSTSVGWTADLTRAGPSVLKSMQRRSPRELVLASVAETVKIRKEQWMECVIADLDQRFPEYAGAITHREMATAQTMQHYLNRRMARVYGFAPEAPCPNDQTRTAHHDQRPMARFGLCGKRRLYRCDVQAVR